MKKHYFYFYAFLFLFSFLSNSLQANPKVDSLLQVLSSTKDARKQYELNVQIALAVKYESVKTAVGYLQTAQGITQQQSWSNEQGQVLLELYNCYRIMPEQDSTLMLQSLDQAQLLFQKSNDDIRYLEAIGYVSSYHFAQERTSLARKFIQDGLIYAAQKKSSVGKGILLANLSKILIEQDSLEEAISVCKEAIKLLNNTTSYTYLGIAYNNIGVVNNIQTRVFEGLENFEKAQYYYTKSNNQPALLSTILNNASVYQVLRDYNSAEKCYLSMLQKCEDSEYTKGIYRCKSKLAELYLSKNEDEKAYLLFKSIAPDYDKYYKGGDYIFLLTTYLKSAVRSEHLDDGRLIYASLEEKVKVFQSQLNNYNVAIARGEYFFAIGAFGKAYNSVKKGIELSLKQKDKIEAKTGYNVLVKICLALNKKQEAAQAFEDYQYIDQQILSDDNLTRATFYKNKQEQEERNIEHAKEITTLQLKSATDQKQNRMLIGFGL